MSKKPIQAVCVFQGDIKGYVLFKEDFKNKTTIVKVEIENIPLRRWVHMVISLNHKYLDIYVNGRLKKRHEFTSTPKQNFGDLWLNLFGGFEGYLCKMQYFRKALSYQEVEKIYPTLVATKEDGTKSVNYTEIIPLLLLQTNEMERKIEELKNNN